MKNRIASGFDFLAPFYDGLARLFIGKDIVNSQLYFLKSFKGCNHLLILGGGSGWILDFIGREFPDLKIDYIDISPMMINSARKKYGGNKNINFIQGSESNIPDRLYDCIITNFYLDMFHERSLKVVIQKIKRSLTENAFWVVTDFVNERRQHRIMLGWMYQFFQLIARIEATHLSDWQNQMVIAEYRIVESKNFKSGFIKSNLYQSGF